MAFQQSMFQPGVILHEVIAGALKSKGTSFDAWCREKGVPRTTARQATYGPSCGPRGQALLDRLIDAAGREVVTVSYRVRMEVEARKAASQVAA